MLRYRRGPGGPGLGVPGAGHRGRLQRGHAGSGPPDGRGPDAGPAGATWVRADARELPFTAAFGLAVSFGALGHFQPAERPALVAGVYRALRPGGLFAVPLAAPPPIWSRGYWAVVGFDLAMRARNMLWRPPFVMYYRTAPWPALRADLAAAGFAVTLVPLPELGQRPDGSPRYGLALARKPG